MASDQVAKRADGRDVVTIGLSIFGVYLVAISLFAVVAPQTFFDQLGRFGPRNDHYIHDVAAFQAAVACSCWRRPVARAGGSPP